MSANAPRKGQYAIAYPSDFATQSAFGTALVDGDIDAVVSLDESQVEVEIVTDKFEIIDCTGEYPIDKALMARSSRISYGFYAEGGTLFGYLGLAGGVIAGNQVTLLPPFTYQPPPTSLITGNRGSSIAPLKFKDMTLDSIRITGRVANRITGRVQFRGHGAPAPVPDYDWADCLTPSPIFMRSGDFTLGALKTAADLREFDFLINNKLVFQEDPFPFNDVDIVRMERDERREWPLNVTTFGELNDATWRLANFQDGNAIGKASYSLRIGSVDDGITIESAGDALVEMQNLGYAGQVARSTEALILTALRPSGEPSPVIITRNLGAESS